MKLELTDWVLLRDNAPVETLRALGDALCERLETAERMVHELQINYGEWHLPYVEPAEAFDAEVLHDADYACRVSVGRCARVSYDRLHAEETPEKSKTRCDGMLSAGHMSPFEHVARPMTEHELHLFKQRKLRWNEEHECWVWVGAKYDREVHVSADGKTRTRISCNARAEGAEVASEGEYTHFLGNLNGWVQYRKLIPHEEDILGART